jgi:hypothetical protein
MEETQPTINITCGPAHDRKNLILSLPINSDPDNILLIGFTGGMDSCLVLYLLAKLNSMLTIPYIIQPFSVIDLYKDRAIEDKENIILMQQLIKNIIDSNIQPVHFVEDSSGLKALQKLYFLLSQYFKIHSAGKCVAIYTGENMHPGPELPGGPKERINGVFPEGEPWQHPLKDLKKYHIVDIIIHMGLHDIFKYTKKCKLNHTSITDPCNYWSCLERRWGFLQINKEDMGIKYFINKEI